MVEGLENNPRFTADPASVEGEGVALADDRVGVEVNFPSVCFVVAVTISNEVELAGIHEAGPMGSLGDPSRTTRGIGRHDIWVPEEVGSSVVTLDRNLFKNDVRVANKVGLEFLTRGQREPTGPHAASFRFLRADRDLRLSLNG